MALGPTGRGLVGASLFLTRKRGPKLKDLLDRRQQASQEEARKKVAGKPFKVEERRFTSEKGAIRPSQPLTREQLLQQFARSRQPQKPLNLADHAAMRDVIRAARLQALDRLRRGK